MLSLYRRHLEDAAGNPPKQRCHSKLKSRGLTAAEITDWKRCSCPIWIVGTDPRGKFHRHSLNTTNWKTAEDQKLQIDEGVLKKEPIKIADATQNWLDALRAAKRKERTVAQVHGPMVKSLVAWCNDLGYEQMDDLEKAEQEKGGVLDGWVKTWDYATSTHRSRIDLARQFFKFAIGRGWIAMNPAKTLIKPKDDTEPTLPFTEEEEYKIFETAKKFPEVVRSCGGLWRENWVTALALLYVLRWTGLRAQDAVLFEPHNIRTMIVKGDLVNVYETYQMKTGDWVLCPIPARIAEFIKAAPRLSEEKAFMPIGDKRYKEDSRNVANNFYDSYLVPLSNFSEVGGIAAHRFRDTLAVRLLDDGKPLEIVQIMLGHKTIKTTEKHYAPWVKSRQHTLIQEVMTSKTWAA